MSKSFNSISALEAEIMKQINSVLNKEVAMVVREEIQTAISEVVYTEEPISYIRRGGNDMGGMGNPLGSGSIADPETMISELISNGVLQITPEAERNVGFNEYSGYGYNDDESLTYNIIMGYKPRDQWFNKPRNFIARAEKNMIEDKSHVEVLADGLRARGLEVI